MDRRQRKTREAVFDAFGSLMKTTAYSKISVQDIIDVANVGRTTFYAHFQTKDDLLKEMCDDLFDHILSDDPIAEATHDFRFGTEPCKILAHILYHIKESDRTVGILTSENGGIFAGFFEARFGECIVRNMLKSFERKGMPNDYLESLIAASFTGTVRWWVSGSMTESPEEMADLFLKIMLP